MLKNRKTPRFEVDYKERLEQKRTATDAVRLPRLGYELYRVYDIEMRKEPKGIKPGPINIYKSRNSKSQVNWQQVLWAFIDEIESRSKPAYDVRWLKPKHATLLRMRGHRVEPAAHGEQPRRVNAQPVRLGR